MTASPPMPDVEETTDETPIEAREEVVAEEAFTGEPVAADVVEEPPIVDVQAIEQSDIVEEVATPAKKTARKRKAAAPKPKAAKANTSSRRTRRAASTRSVA
jgi:hypothetical protein